MKAWLVMPDESRLEIGSNCQIGRAPGSAVQIDSAEVSRRHAFIHVQQSERGTEYWIADLGSTNGTIRNGRRVAIPCRLHDGDRIQVGDTSLVFRLEDSSEDVLSDDQVMMTVPLQAARFCWLVMLDIKSYTRIMHTLTPEALGHRVGTWLRRTRDTIENARGVVDKFLGDAVFAYWEAGPETTRTVARALEELQAMQAARAPDFRIVVHLGPAMLAGGAGGADNVSGLEVIFVFRMEKVASRLGLDSIVSEAAREQLHAFLPCEPVGSHPLDGFDGTRAMFTLSGPPAKPGSA